MLFETFVLGPLQTNCYLLSGDGRHAVIIDPAENGEQIAQYLEKKGLLLDAIFLTHAHYDHLGGLTLLQQRTGSPVYLHQEDLAIAPAMAYGRLQVPTLAYPDTMEAAGLSFTIYHTSGHSPGSVCIRVGDLLFTGDTLFSGSCGRIDFPGGSWEEMACSLRFLASLEGDPAIYPGHGDNSRISIECKYNPYLKEARDT